MDPCFVFVILPSDLADHRTISRVAFWWTADIPSSWPLDLQIPEASGVHAGQADEVGHQRTVGEGRGPGEQRLFLHGLSVSKALLNRGVCESTSGLCRRYAISRRSTVGCRMSPQLLVSVNLLVLSGTSCAFTRSLTRIGAPPCMGSC